MIYFKLFWSFFQIGLFSFGGGYAAIPLMQNQVVDLHSWLSISEFADVITISQMTPGSIAVNAATFIGIRIAGIQGAVVATLGCVFPSCMIVLFLAYIYYKFRELSVVQGVLNGLRPAVIALIASAGATLMILAFWSGKGVSGNLDNVDVISIAIFFVTLLIIRKSKINPIIVLFGAGILGLCIYPFFS